MKKTVEYHVVTVKRHCGIDKYYRKIEKDAFAICKLNEDLYPKAKIKLSKEKIIEDSENERKDNN